MEAQFLSTSKYCKAHCWFNIQNNKAFCILCKIIWYGRSLNLLEKILESPGKVLEFHIQLTVATLGINNGDVGVGDGDYNDGGDVDVDDDNDEM